MLFSGITVDVRFQDDMDEDRMHAARAAYYKEASHQGRTVLVLGAGNIAAIPAMDVITKLFNEGKASLLKMNPVNAYLGPFIEAAFAEPIRRGFVAVVYGGADEGAYLVQHAGIDEIHLHGSRSNLRPDRMGPAGSGAGCAEGRQRAGARQAGHRRAGERVSSAGGAGAIHRSPAGVPGGKYRRRGGHERVFPVQFPQNADHAEGMERPRPAAGGARACLGVGPVRRAYYPGAEDRWRALTGERAQKRTVGTAGPGELPWTILPGLDATDSREPAFRTEPFCSILSETEVGSDDPVEFLDRAVDFANKRLWGTLSADLVIHPKAVKDPRLAAAASGRSRGCATARSGWTAASGFLCVRDSALGRLSRLGARRHPERDRWVHNTTMLEGIEKAVLRQPLTIVPKPATFPSHRTAHTMLRRLTALEERASWGRVPGVVAAAMRG